MDEVNTKVQPKTFTVVAGKTANINKYVILGINAIFILPFVTRNYSVMGISTFFVAMLFVFIVIFKSSNKIPAIVYVPIILLADIVTYVGIHFLELKSTINVESFTSYFTNANSMLWVIFLVGLVVGWVGITNVRVAWITGLSGGLIGVFVILVGWSNCDISNFQFIDSGSSLLVLFVILDILLTIILYFIVNTVPEKVNNTICIDVILLCIFLAGLIFWTDYIKECLPAWKVGLLECSHTIFAWWKVILSSIVILAGIFILYMMDGNNGNNLSVDTYALIVLEEIILTTKILMSNYFSFNGLILFGLIIGTVSCMRKDYFGEKIFKLDGVVYLLIQYFVVLLTIFLFKKGLWINVVVSVVFFIAFYVDYNKHQKANSNTVCWIMILLCLVSETFALEWRRHFSLDLVILLILVLGSSILTILAINLKQPGGRMAPNVLRIVVCVCVAAICLTAVSQNSIAIDYVTDNVNKNVTVNIESKDKNNSLASAYYYWRDITGNVYAEDIEIQCNEFTVPIENEILTIVVKDEQGFVSSKVIWYPYWINTVLE